MINHPAVGNQAGDTPPESCAADGASAPPLGPSAPANADTTDRRVFAGRMSPGDIVVIAYLAAIAALAAIFHRRVEHWWILVAAHAAAIALVCAMARWQRTQTSLGAYAIRSWHPVAFISCSYKELTYLVHRLNPHDADWPLAALDRRLFGVDPTLWIQRLVTPWLTEVLQVAYFGYYFYPLGFGLLLWHKRRFRALHYFIFVGALGFYLSFIGYITVPAIGPRFVLKDVYSVPLQGLLLFPWIRDGLDYLEGITRDCFPSGHTELTLLVLYGAFKFHRRTFWWLLLPGSALIFSTVYLRYHWVVDVIAGAALAFAIMFVGEWVYRALAGRATPDAELGPRSPSV